MKKLLLFLFCIPYLGITQNSYIINTVGSTFSPSSLTINVGDTVTWNNTAGFHNINATQATFTSNPEGFGNSVASAPWSFQWVFTMLGAYDYHCDPHVPGMSGIIIANALPVPGCIDSTAINYDPLATLDDGSCNYSPVGNLFISEYAEGTSYNKYIEIYNGTGSSVDLSDYDIWKITNGGNWPEFSLSLTGTLANNEVYVICSSNSNVSATILNTADTLWSSASWNGDDAVGLAKNGVLIDAVGNGVDPGIAWDVAGVVEATKDHTLIRKCSVTQGDTNWIASAGVDSLTSQWLVYPQDYWIDIDQHSGFCGCTDPLACNYDSLANTDDGSCAYDVIWQQNEIICNGDSVMVGSNIYYLSGSYTDSLSTIYGCDSTVYTTLTVNNSTDFQQSITLCEGDSLVVGLNIYYNTGNYLDTLTTISGCDSIIFSDLDFYQSPPLFIQTSPDPPEICIGETILLEGSTGFSYYWWDNGSTGSSLVDDPTLDTWYLLSAKDSNDCVVKEDIWVFIDSCITSLNEISVNIDLKVYPNPASDKVSILLSTKKNEMQFIEVINTLGEIVNEHIIYSNLPLTIDVAVFTAGTYAILLKDNKGRTIQTKRLIVD
jgi:plastocyanin